tara:strand:- start:56910 stop:57968 length:1059 start_codon:yes stop_codon:yes gene_type:complete
MNDSPLNLKVPKHIKKGDKVALVTSSWGGPATFTKKYNIGKQQLESYFNVQAIEMPHTLDSAENVYNNPNTRAKDLMQAFSDPEIRGIISCIGGSDSIRMLPYIDYNIIKNNPKPFLGYSDSTITHFICLKAGIRSYYGPSIMAGFAENGGLFNYMKKSVQKTLFSNNTIGKIEPCTEGWVVKQYPWDKEELFHKKRELQPPMERELLLGSGKARGHLIGGCMESLEAIKATPIWPSLESWCGAILFFETSEDSPSVTTVTDWLRNYAAQGILGIINGIILARPGGECDEDNLKKQEEAFVDVIYGEYGLDIPILSRLDFGHTDPQFVIPYGARAEIDCKQKTFSILDSGCK